ncbi:hypothetical protein AnigIFM49718_001828 [Aspergillus niger]|nr:hypothetical protein AnigIFM49718_001828 [Aspergillus niger]
MPNAIGIDLGISYVSIAVVQDGNVHIIPDIHGRKRIPSPYLLRTPVTHNINPANVNPVCRPLRYSKEDARVILAAAKALAESYVGTTVDDAVITVPSFYNDMERVETRDAGRQVGLKVHRLLNTPTAAAIAQWADFPTFDAHLMLVLDIGARGAESTILDVCNGLFEVKSSQGDCQLGGHSYDLKLRRYLEYHTRGQIQGGDLESLLSRTEELKRSLSVRESISDASGVVITRKEYEDVCKSNFTATVDLVKRTLHIAKVEKSDIQEVVFVGGTASTPILQKILADFFGCSRRDLYCPQMAAVRGAALQAASLTDRVFFSELLILDVVPGPIHIELLPGFLLQLWPRNTTLTRESSIIIEVLSPEYLPRFVKLIEGDSRSVRTLGIFDLRCLQLPSDCQATIEIKVSIDLDGIVDADVALRHPESGITIPLQRMPVADNQPNMDDDTKLIQPSESPSTALLESYISFLQLIAPKLSTECQDTLRAAIVHVESTMTQQSSKTGQARAMALEYLIR